MGGAGIFTQDTKHLSHELSRYTIALGLSIGMLHFKSIRMLIKSEFVTSLQCFIFQVSS